jgi:hypothetical protein
MQLRECLILCFAGAKFPEGSHGLGVAGFACRALRAAHRAAMRLDLPASIVPSLRSADASAPMVLRPPVAKNTLLFQVPDVCAPFPWRYRVRVNP